MNGRRTKLIVLLATAAAAVAAAATVTAAPAGATGFPADLANVRSILLNNGQIFQKGRDAAVFGHDWQSAEGKCIDIRLKTTHGNSGTDNRSWLMEIHCADAEPFRVELGYPGFHEDFKGPARGQTCRMKCDPKKQEAKWDLDDPSLSWKAEQKQKDAKFKAELNAKPWGDQPDS